MYILYIALSDAVYLGKRGRRGDDCCTSALAKSVDGGKEVVWLQSSQAEHSVLHKYWSDVSLLLDLIST